MGWTRFGGARGRVDVSVDGTGNRVPLSESCVQDNDSDTSYKS